jgi:hypothetical protein
MLVDEFLLSSGRTGQSESRGCLDTLLAAWSVSTACNRYGERFSASIWAESARLGVRALSAAWPSGCGW